MTYFIICKYSLKMYVLGLGNRQLLKIKCFRHAKKRNIYFLCDNSLAFVTNEVLLIFKYPNNGGPDHCTFNRKHDMIRLFYLKNEPLSTRGIKSVP